MRLALASDHTGVAARAAVREVLDRLQVEYDDLGTNSEEAVDYPDIAAEAGRAVAAGTYDQAILICGTGIGMSIAANKVPGVLAAVCHDEFTTEMARKHNHANVLCLGARILKPDRLKKLVEVWLETEEEGGRHERRVRKMLDIERCG